jgi:hypothetical protein
LSSLVSDPPSIAGTAFGNLQTPKSWWHDPWVMAHFPQSHSKKRSPRVRVPNDEMVRFNIDGRLVPGVLQRLSLTGGLAEFPAPVNAGNIAEVQLNTTLGPVSGLVEFLREEQKAGPTSHPFRFIALGDGDYKRLNATLTLMRRLGLGVDAN